MGEGAEVTAETSRLVAHGRRCCQQYRGQPPPREWRQVPSLPQYQQVPPQKQLSARAPPCTSESQEKATASLCLLTGAQRLTESDYTNRFKKIHFLYNILRKLSSGKSRFKKPGKDCISYTYFLTCGIIQLVLSQVQQANPFFNKNNKPENRSSLQLMNPSKVLPV